MGKFSSYGSNSGEFYDRVSGKALCPHCNQYKRVVLCPAGYAVMDQHKITKKGTKRGRKIRRISCPGRGERPTDPYNQLRD